MGSRSKFNQALLERICARLAEGTPLTQICRDEGNISPRTIRDWEAKRPDVAAAIARAREDGEYALAESCLAIADTLQQGEEVEIDKSGKVIKVKRGDMLGHRKLQIETRLKLLAKFNPKRWGERVAQEVSGPDGGPVESVTVVERRLVRSND